MKKVFSVIVLCFYANMVQAQISIPKEIRTLNSDSSGVCWWCCASMIGKHLGIMPLQDIDKQVLQNGVGHKTGATQESIDFWMQRLNLKPLTNPIGNKDADAVKKLMSWLDRKLPVIISYEHKTGSHAVLITNITRHKEKWSETLQDYSVTYIDPDDTKQYTVTWSWFIRAWTGKAYTFDPKDQDPRLVRQPDLRPGRLMMASKKFELAHVSPPIEIRKEYPPYLPHQLPFKTDYPYQNETIKIPSNQDLKDGVTRPLDIINNPYYGFPYDYDYHTEYNAYKAQRNKQNVSR